MSVTTNPVIGERSGRGTASAGARPAPSWRRGPRSGLAGLLAAALLLVLPASAGPHEIPAEVTVRAHATAEGDVFRLLVRMPLSASRDVRFPLRGPGYLDVEEIGPELREAARLWIAGYVDVYEGDRELGSGRIAATRVSLPSDRSFRAGWEEALAHVTGPGLEPDVDLPPEQASLDVLLEYPIRSADSRFSVEPRLAHLGMSTETHLRWHGPDGASRRFHYAGDPGRVWMNPGWWRAVRRFLGEGIAAVLGGTEQLLVLLCLALPFTALRRAAPLAVSFCAGLALALGVSAAGLTPWRLWYPPLVATLTAASVLYAAAANVVGARLRSRWPAALVFGLVHGAALHLPLREGLQFAGAHREAAVAAFGAGAAAAAALALLAAAALYRWLVGRGLPERIGVVLVSALAGHEAWHWLTERAALLGRYSFELPAADLRLAADLAGVAMALLVLVGVAWALRELFGRLGWLTSGRGDA